MEVGWYDTNNPSTLATKVADLSGKLQDGITSRAAELFQVIIIIIIIILINKIILIIINHYKFGGQFIGSYIVGLYLSWKLALVLMCALPLIAGSGGFMVMVIFFHNDNNNHNIINYH